MNFAFIAYIFVSIAVGLSVPMYLYNSQRMISAIITLILFIFVFIFFGIRWFSTGNLVGTYTGSWPPLINTCPDYLVYFKKGTMDTCIDLIGVNRSNGALFPWSQDDSTSNPPSNSNKYFPFIYKAGMSQNQLKVLCNAAQQLGLTWEGITNGESCSYAPPSQVLGPNAAGPSGASCPSLTESIETSLQTQWSKMADAAGLGSAPARTT
jgi:hypothetical protein